MKYFLHKNLNLQFYKAMRYVLEYFSYIFFCFHSTMFKLKILIFSYICFNKVVVSKDGLSDIYLRLDNEVQHQYMYLTINVLLHILSVLWRHVQKVLIKHSNSVVNFFVFLFLIKDVPGRILSCQTLSYHR